jgi:hypothetical protein
VAQTNPRTRGGAATARTRALDPVSLRFRYPTEEQFGHQRRGILDSSATELDARGLAHRWERVISAPRGLSRCSESWPSLRISRRADAWLSHSRAVSCQYK